MPPFGSLHSDRSAHILPLGTLPLISLLSDLFARIPLLGSIRFDPSDRFPKLESFRSDNSTRIPRSDPSDKTHPLGSLYSDPSTRVPPLGYIHSYSFAWIPPLRSISSDPFTWILCSDPSAHIYQLESLPDIIALNCNCVGRINTLKYR